MNLPLHSDVSVEWLAPLILGYVFGLLHGRTLHRCYYRDWVESFKRGQSKTSQSAIEECKKEPPQQ